MPKLVLTWGPTRDGRMIGVISDGSPQLGDDGVTCLAVELCPTQRDAEAWFERMKVERPWEARN
jgi:hypothetical protein